MPSLALVLVITCLSASLAQAAPQQPEDVPPQIMNNRDGLPEVTVQSTFFGAYAAASTSNAIFGHDGVRIAWSTILGAGIGVALPLIALHNRDITVAQAATYNAAELWGLNWGAALPQLWGGVDGRNINAGAAIGGVVGLGAGILLHPMLRLTPAQASSVTLAGAVGLVAGLSAGLIFNPNLQPGVGFALASVLPANAFVAGTLLLRDGLDVDRSRIYWAGVGAIVGEAVSLGVYKIAVGRHDNGRPLGIASLAGVLAGTVLGYYLSDGQDTFRATAEDPGAQLEVLQPAMLTMEGGPYGASTAMGFDLVRGAL